MFRLRRLEIRSYRGLTRAITLEFGPRYHLILGVNGAGKTNLLKLLTMVTRLDFSALAQESFDIAWEGSDDQGNSITARVRRELGAAGPGRLAARREAAAWDWEVSLSGAAGVSCSASSRAPGDGATEEEDPCGAHALEVALISVAPDPVIVAGFVDAMGAARADEALGVFEGLVEGREAGPGEGLPAPWQLKVWGSAPDDWLASGLPSSARPADGYALYMAQQAWANQVATGQSPRIRAAEAPWLLQAQADLGALNIWMEPLLRERTSRKDSSGGPDQQEITFRGGSLYVSFSARSTVRHEKLSFGQKRLLGLRYYLSALDSAPAIIDELSNGLHHAWVESLLRDMEERQSFLATQNPLVMDPVWWESAEEAQRGIVLCGVDGEAGWAWRQLTSEEAIRFVSAWRSGVRHIHEILRDEGWW